MNGNAVGIPYDMEAQETTGKKQFRDLSKTEHGRRPFSANLCLTELPRPSPQNFLFSFSCHLCEFTSHTQEELITHISQHNLKCARCTFSSFSRIEFNKHLKCKHGGDVNKMESQNAIAAVQDEIPCSACIFCGFMTYSEERLGKHNEEQHHGHISQSISKIVSKSDGQKIRQADALFLISIQSKSTDSNCKDLLESSHNSVHSTDNLIPADFKRDEDLERISDGKLGSSRPCSIKYESAGGDTAENENLSNKSSLGQSLEFPSSHDKQIKLEKDSLMSRPSTADSEPILIQSAVSHIINKSEDLEIDIAGKLLSGSGYRFHSDHILKKENCDEEIEETGVKINHSIDEDFDDDEINDDDDDDRFSIVNGEFKMEIDESSMDEREEDDEEKLIPFAEDSDSIMIRQIGSYVCWICLQKFMHCLNVKNHIFYQHPLKAFCAVVYEETEDMNADLQLLLFCPKNCKYATTEVESLSEHIANCLYPNMVNDGRDYLNIHSTFISQDFKQLQDQVTSGDLVKAIRQKSSNGAREGERRNRNDDGLGELYDSRGSETCNQTSHTQGQSDPTKPWANNNNNGCGNGQETLVVDYDSDDIFYCHVCKLAFLTSLFLERHLQKQHQEEYMRIMRENGSFFNLGVKTVRGKRFKCHLCEKSFQRNSHLQRHVKSHSGEKPFECSECGKFFTQNSSLMLHMRTHTGEKPFECNECGKTFIRNSHLILHMRTHTGERPFECDECGRRFIQTSQLQIHMRTHTGEKPFECKECGKTFSRNSHLNLHIRTHTGERPFECSECGRSFSQSSQLYSHIKTHTGEKPYKCNECGKTFRRNGLLLIHVRKHLRKKSVDGSDNEAYEEEMGGKTFRCKSCDKCFNYQGQLLVHMRTHTGEKPYECSECCKKFSQSGHLVTHMRTHTGEKPFKCRQCDKSFTQKGQLQLHEWKHTGRKPFQCKECNKSFNQVGYLHTHMRTHTGERLFQCTYCTRSFTLKCYLDKHMKVHKGGDENIKHTN